MRGKAVILTPVAEEPHGRSELFTGAVDVAVVIAGAVGAPVGDVAPGDGIAAAVLAAAIAAGPAVDATAGAAPDPAPTAGGGSDTGAGGPIWPEGA